MSNQKSLIDDPNAKPIPTVTNFHTDHDDFIIEYAEVEHVKVVGPKDTDFIVEKRVEEISRVRRQDVYDSYSNDVGILNIVKKVAMSGDTSLYNQTGRVGVPLDGTDVLGNKVERVVDVTGYQVADQVVALEAYKKGVKAFRDLDPELKKKLSMEAVANMSDEDIDKYLGDKMAALVSKKEGDGGDK